MYHVIFIHSSVVGHLDCFHVLANINSTLGYMCLFESWFSQGMFGFPCWLSWWRICNVGDLGLIPGLGGSPGEGKGYPLQHSGLENSMDCLYNLWSHKESDTTEWLSLSLSPLWTGWNFNFLAYLKGSSQWSANLPFSNLIVGDLDKLFTQLHETIYQYLKKIHISSQPAPHHASIFEHLLIIQDSIQCNVPLMTSCISRAKCFLFFCSSEVV